MDWYKLADKYFSNDRLETGASKLQQTSVIGTAISDSNNGYAKVLVDGNVTYPDDSDADGVYIPTGPSIKEGDRVHISLNGGVGKNPIITNATGWGDRLASETIEIANEAMAVASATNQHFWTDTNGAHVTDVTQDQWREAEEDDFSDISYQKPYHNALWNSLGMLFRSGLKNLVSITRSAIAFFNGTGNTSDDIVASFGKDGFQIGVNTESHLVGDYHSLNLIDKEGNSYFKAADLRDQNGFAEILEVLGAFAQQPYLIPSYEVDELISVEGEGQVTATLDQEHGVIVIDPTPQRFESFIVRYITTDTTLKSYTLGIRNPDPSAKSGGMSVAEGAMNEASGKYSHAEGYSNTVSGEVAHAEGAHNIAYTMGDHAEGYHTVAGSGIFGPQTNHAEGTYTRATGGSSHAQNAGTIASGSAQTAIGRYNVEDYGDYALIIGNGTDSQNRSNCLTVKWNGDVETSGDIISGQSSATVSTNSYVAEGSIQLDKSGGFCEARVAGIRLNAFSSRTTIGTIPTGFRPKGEIYIFDTNMAGYFILEPDGSFKAEPSLASRWVYASGSYKL